MAKARSAKAISSGAKSSSGSLTIGLELGIWDNVLGIVLDLPSLWCNSTLKRWMYSEARSSRRFECFGLVVANEVCLAIPSEAPWSV